MVSLRNISLWTWGSKSFRFFVEDLNIIDLICLDELYKLSEKLTMFAPFYGYYLLPMEGALFSYKIDLASTNVGNK